MQHNKFKTTINKYDLKIAGIPKLPTFRAELVILNTKSEK